MGRRVPEENGKGRWWLPLLAVVLLLAMALTLWATGKGLVKSKHGVGQVHAIKRGASA